MSLQEEHSGWLLQGAQEISAQWDIAGSGRMIRDRREKESRELKFPYISGVLDLFLPLKNSGRALRSMA